MLRYSASFSLCLSDWRQRFILFMTRAACFGYLCKNVYFLTVQHTHSLLLFPLYTSFPFSLSCILSCFQFLFEAWWCCVVLVYCKDVMQPRWICFVYKYQQKLLLLMDDKMANKLVQMQAETLSKFGHLLPLAHCNVVNSAKAFPFFILFCYGLLLLVALVPLCVFFFFLYILHIKGASYSQL